MAYPFLEQGDAKWLHVRQQCAVTASRYADALGVGYKSRKRLMEEKLGLKPPDESNDLMQFGIDNEAWVCEVYFRLMREFGYNIRMWSHGFHFDRKDERLGGSIDRVVECQDTGARWVLECKTSKYGAMRTEIPISHRIQMVGLCEAYALPFAHYICWSPNAGIMLARMDYDRHNLWQLCLFPRLRDFARLWALKQLPPRMSSSEKQDVIEACEKLIYVTPITGNKSPQLQ